MKNTLSVFPLRVDFELFVTADTRLPPGNDVSGLPLYRDELFHQCRLRGWNGVCQATQDLTQSFFCNCIDRSVQLSTSGLIEKNFLIRALRT